MEKELRKKIEEFREKPKPGIETTAPRARSPKEEGTLPGDTRATFIVNKKVVDRIKEIAFKNDLKIKEVVDRAFREFINNYDNGGEKESDI